MSELSGKELGIAVAKKVMEWKEWQPKELEAAFANEDMEAIVEFYPYWTDPGESLDSLYVYRLGDARLVDVRWAPWRDMNDAWEVVEKMLEYAHSFELEWCGPHGNQSWLCFMSWKRRMGYPAYSNAVQEAILRAALKAKGGGDELQSP